MTPQMLASLAALFSAGVSAPKLLAQGSLVEWAPAIVVGAISAIGWAVNHGTLTQRVKGHGDAIREVKADVKEAKADIKDHGERIIVLEQRLPTPRHHMGD